MMLSKLPELIPQAIFQIKPSPFGSAIGETATGTMNTVRGNLARDSLVGTAVGPWAHEKTEAWVSKPGKIQDIKIKGKTIGSRAAGLINRRKANLWKDGNP